MTALPEDLPEALELPETPPTAPAPVASAGGGASATPARPLLALAVLLVAVFVQILDVSIVNTAIPAIQRELDASFAQVQLVLVAYQLGFACTLITGARLGDRLGRRRLFLAGMTGFTLASLLCGLAPTPELLIAARILQGVCSGLMFPQVLTAIQGMFAPSERGKALGMYGATIGLATILGPVAGGGLIALDPLDLGWRSVFLVNLPIGVLAVIAGTRLLPETRSPRAPRLDPLGITLLALGLAAVLYPLIQGRELGWPAWSLVLLAAGVLVLGGFALLQRRESQRGAEPLVPAGLLRVRRFRRGLVLQMVFYAVLPAFFLTLTLSLQVGVGLTALEAGLVTLVVALGSVVTAVVSTKLPSRLGPSILSIGALTAVVATGGLTLQLRGDTLGSPLALTPLLFLLGASLGLVIAPAIQVILADVEEADHGAASGVLSTAGQLGGALGIALIGVVFFHLLAASGPQSAENTHGEVRAQLRAAAVPERLHPQILDQLDACVQARAAEPDPASEPAACTTPPVLALLRSGPVPAGGVQDFLGATGAASGSYPQVEEILARASETAREEGFLRAWRGALLAETVLLLLALGLTFGLRAPRTSESAGAGRAGE